MKEQPKDSNSIKMQVISRSSIPEINSVIVDGILHDLGRLFDFRKHPDLASFIPENARPSFAWVNLEPHKELAAHEHPTSSMIIVCKGQGDVFGDCNQNIQAGDVIIVPPYYQHGFRGGSKEGLWCLSIQFEGLGLYENTEAPRVEFVEENKKFKKDEFDLLLKDQEYFVKTFKTHAWIQFIQSKSMEDIEIKERALEVLNIWGNWFQRIIYMRAATGAPGEFQNLAEQHILEEVGHNTNLLNMRKTKEITLNDPLLEATSSWFFEKMISSTVEEKTILVHFVIEAAGDVFHAKAVKWFPDAPHFTTHAYLDEDHFSMGCRVLKESGYADIERLRLTLRKGWEMFYIVASRFANYAEYGSVEIRDAINFAKAS